MSNAPTRTHAVTPTVTPTTQQRQSAAESQSGEGGKRMFRRQNGEMIELPPDMSIMEAVKIELEALAAEKKLGKGQQPKPLKPKAPVVTPAAAADKAAKKVKPKDKKSKNAKKGSTNPKGGAGKGILGALGKSKVAQYLASLGGPVLMRGLQKLVQLKTNEQTHDTPAAKLSQTQMAVVPPAHEGQSKSHGDQVQDLGAKPEPKPDPGAAKQSLQKSLDENIPQSIEDVDNFKKNKKASHISRNVMNVVQGDTNDVTDTFGEMEKPRPAAPPTHTPETLPPEEIAPATPNMQLGTDAVAPLKAEHTDMSKFSKDSDDMLKKEEISQEQLDMVDSGDLAEANKDRKKLKKDVQEQPAQVRKAAEGERKQVDQSLQQEEQKGKADLKNKRKAGLNATRGKQTGTKSLMEQKREKVATDIKNIYEKAKNKVNTRLAELETQSMKRFDDGNAAASKKFEDDVNKDLAAFKSKRYSGFWGWAKKAKDWLLGMDELPEVNEIFQRNKGIFVDTVNQLVADISADNQKVIKECKAEIDGAKTEIAKYVKNLGPDLKSEGDKAMKEMTEKLNMLDNEVAEKEKELANKLKDKQANAIKAIDQKIEKMKESMSGALSKLGKLLLEAAKKFFTWALQKFGYSLGEIEGIINKGAAVLKAIFTKPLKFVKNLFNAADQGFSNFGKNFLTHLKNALFSWLTGSLTEVKLPDTWDLKGIASVALEMVGISYQNIRKHLVKIIPEPVVEGMEKGFEIVKALITEGPMAAWEQLQEMAGEMKEAFVDAVKNWIKETIIVKAIEFIASLIIPGAGIIKAIIGIYDTVVFFIQKAKDIAQMVGNFLGSIGEIAMGNIGAAANALENGLATALTLVISFLAKLIHLDGVTAKIRAALNKIRGKVENMMAKVAKWIAEKAKKLFGKDKGKDEKNNNSDEKDLGLKIVKDAVTEVEGKVKTNHGELPEDYVSYLNGVKNKYKLKKLELEKGAGGIYNIYGEVNPKFRGDLELLSHIQRKELKREVPRFIEILTKPENNNKSQGKTVLADYKKNPIAFLSDENGQGSTIMGEAVEALSLVDLREDIRKTPGVSILQSVRMAPTDIHGNNLKPKSHQNEIDFLVLGSDKIQKIVSAKANHTRVDVNVEHDKITLINGFPNHAGPDKTTLYSEKHLDYSIKQDTNRKNIYDVYGAVLMYTEDREEKTMEVGSFKSKFLNRVKVDKIDVEGRALNPEDTSEFVKARTKTLGITKTKLIPILAEYINRQLK
jgi:hypothetical protein